MTSRNKQAQSGSRSKALRIALLLLTLAPASVWLGSRLHAELSNHLPTEEPSESDQSERPEPTPVEADSSLELHSSRHELSTASTDCFEASPSSGSETAQPQSQRQAKRADRRHTAKHNGNQQGWCEHGEVSLRQRLVFLNAFANTTVISKASPHRKERRFHLHTEQGVSLLNQEAVSLALEHLGIHLGIKWDHHLPEVYLYAERESLHRYACAPEEAAAYYDGAIHLLAGEDPVELARSLVHEAVHHVMRIGGIEEPGWFDEGVAALQARERWRDWRPEGASPLSLNEMASEPPHGRPLRQVRAYYGQAFAMVLFIERLCSLRPQCSAQANSSLSRVVALLRSGEVSPDQLFLHVAALRLGESERIAERLWEIYWENELSFHEAQAAEGTVGLTDSVSSHRSQVRQLVADIKSGTR